MKITSFIELGSIAVMASILLNGFAPNGQDPIKYKNLAQGISMEFVNQFRDGVDNASYKLTGEALTQDTANYRYNVMRTYMEGFYRFNLNQLEDSDKTKHNNLLTAKALGVFKDKEAFEGEFTILKSSIAREQPDATNPILIEDMLGMVDWIKGVKHPKSESLTDDITNFGYYSGIHNIEQAKQAIKERMEIIHGAKLAQVANKIKPT